MEILLSFITIAFSILQIALFIKVWEITNNVKRLTEHFCNSPQQGNVNHKQPQTRTQEQYDKRLDSIRPGDKVESIKTGQELIVDSIDGDRFFCSKGKFSGYEYFKKSEVRYIE